jgi:hypothetical protein
MRIEYTINDADFRSKDRNLDSLGNIGTRGLEVNIPTFL